ncbi:SusD/RagB family nutrient-binding outer membrane lipoprotein [Massilibacteroides vaginae]|uniref:SusD/RagB family nutrient-binding outer membrane lipoprotein n=1 Tax=Massilibacteroides vaginae TaxID=1673718 RepID=UPI000A1CD464|nr:SusD/RagB family nutrient-binding outer membrane lipoprotein [Massilibacteroides vaginae]
MKIKNITKNILSVIVVGFLSSSCSEDTMDRINKDRDHTTDVSARYIISDVMTKTAFSSVGGDFNAYFSIYIEHELGTHNQFLRADMRNGEPSSSSTFNNTWGSTYQSLKNAKNVISKCSEGGLEEGNNITLGVGQILAAYNLAILTDMYGDVPWKEAGDYTITKNPVIDKQEVIYQDILKYIDDAIVNLQKSDLKGMATQDLIYGGKANLWLKTAYALKARYTMRLLHKSSNVQANMETVLDCVSKSFTSSSEQCSFDVFGGSQYNPVWGINSARGGLGASKSMFDRLVTLDDPRIGRCFWDPETEEIFPSATAKGINIKPNGGGFESQLGFTTSVFIAATYAPIHLISYHEMLFLKAEALVHLNRLDEANKTLREAVISGFANMENNVQEAINGIWKLKSSTNPVTAEDAAQYYDEKIAPLFSANALKTVMIQKYIAFWGSNGESTEAYNDVRRMKAMGNDFYELQNPNKFPLRAPYGNGDTTTNPNVEAAYGDGKYVYTEPVWWAGGNR